MASHLRSLKPSAEEVAAAKKILDANGDKEAKSRITKAAGVNMKSWASRTKDVSVEDREVLNNSRGSARQELTMLYLVHQLRAKKGTQVTESYQRDDSIDEDTIHEWGEENMDIAMGANRAKFLRESGTIPWIPCSRTGSTDRWAVIWQVSEKLAKTVKVNGSKTGIRAEAEASAEDLATLEASKSGKAASSAPQAPVVPVKLEAKSPEEIIVEEVKRLKENPGTQMRRLIDIELTEAEWKVKASAIPLAGVLLDQISAQSIKIGKTKKVLEKVVKGETLKEGGLEGLNLLLKQLEEQHQVNHKGAMTFGIAKGLKRARAA